MSRAMIFWACMALLLMAAEAFAPGAFLLWLGFAAAGVFVLVALWPLGALGQAVAFVLLSFASIGVYLRWFRRAGDAASDQPTLNRRSEQYIGQVFALETAIVGGRGRVKIGDAFWTVAGPDLPVGAPVRVIAADRMVLQVQPAE